MMRRACHRGFGFVFAIVTTVMLMVAASAPSPFYPQFAERLGLPAVATTSVFAVYAFTMLAALLLAGALSDVVGRRRVITAGSVLLAVSLVLFWHSDSLAMLLIARGIQGVAAGILLPALSAMVVDFAPMGRSDAASLWNTIAGMIGLGIGAITAALLLDVAADPAGVVFGSLALVFLLVSVLVWAAPEAGGSTRRTVLSAVSRPAVPGYLRRPLMAAVPAIIAGWATNGLFLALGSSLVRQEFGATTHAAQSIAIPVFAASGIIAAVGLHRRPPRVISLYGSSALGIGTALTLAGLLFHSLPGYLAAVAVVGTGFGTAFMGVLKTLMPRVEPTERAAVMSTIYTVSYVAFGVPTIVAGLLVPVISLQGAMIVLGAGVVVLSLIATITRVRIRDQDAQATDAPRADTIHPVLTPESGVPR